jgi:threonine/homoserine/homoserine lactone efflux protein
MLQFLIIGIGFAFAAGVQPGVLQAFLLNSVAEKGWRHTLPASFAPLLSDTPIAIMILLVLKNLPPEARHILQAAGGVLLIYYAIASYRRWKKGTNGQTTAKGSAPKTLLQATMVNILNPHPYLGWSFVLGPAVISAWHKNPVYAVVLIVSFYTILILMNALTVVLFGAALKLGEKVEKKLVFISIITLAALGIYLLTASLF